MSLFPQSFIDDLRLQANIVRVVQEYVPSLKRAGTTYKGLCPFHSERTPSFTVNPEKGFFYCFGCHAGGDVFKFLELHEKIGFQDAVKMLAQKFGVALPEHTEGAGDEDRRKDASLREALLKMHEIAAAYLREQLAAPAGSRARQQLAERRVTPITIERLGLGYAPATSRDGLKSRLLKQGFAQGLIVQSGLVSQRDNGDTFDRFRNRLMIPICRETDGSIVAFGGRSMDADQVPKYLNSPETGIYSKGRTLYGLNLTKAAIKKADYALLVEGYFDFAQVFQSETFHAHGAPVIASCGTALTIPQAHLLRRFTTNVKLNFDPDAAGQNAATRSCELLVGEGFEVKVVVLDKGEDPDTFLQKHGAEPYREKLRTARPYLDYVINRESSGVDFGSGEARNRFIERMRAFADMLPDDATKEVFAEKVAFTAGVTDGTVLIQFRKSFRTKQTLAGPILPSFGDLKSAEKALIWWLIQRPDEARVVLDTLEEEDLHVLAARGIFEMARSLHEEPAERLPAALIQRLSTVDAQLVAKIASEPAPPATLVNDCVREMKRLRCDRERAAIQQEIDRLQELGATQHGQEIDNLWQRKKVLLHRIEALT